MNTVKSVYYGWATLIVAGGGAYFFAKREINADRAAKAELDRQKRIRQYEMEHQTLYAAPAAPTTPLNPTSSAPRPATSQAGRPHRQGASGGAGLQGDANPSIQASQDPAPTRHAPEDEAQKVGEKSKYEASEVYRSRKGDRFS